MNKKILTLGAAVAAVLATGHAEAQVATSRYALPLELAMEAAADRAATRTRSVPKPALPRSRIASPRPKSSPADAGGSRLPALAAVYPRRSNQHPAAC